MMTSLSFSIFVGFLCCCSSVSGNSANPGTVKSHKEALINFSKNLDLPHWTSNSGWHQESGFSSSNNDPCDNPWFGIKCSFDENRNHFVVTEISLADNNLKGVFDAGTLADIDTLEIINVSNNHLTSVQNMHMVKSVKKINFQSAIAVSTKVPLESLLPHAEAPLEEFHAGGIGLTGIIPDRFYHFTELRSVHLFENELEGHLRPAIKHLRNLEIINVATNNLKGPIPKALRDLPKLRLVNLSHNQFHSLHDHVASGISLEIFDASHNRIGGEINRPFGSPTRPEEQSSLVEFIVSHNEISGFPPAGAELVPHLRTLDISANLLTGRVPDEYESISKSAKVSLAMNPLECPIPDFAKERFQARCRQMHDEL